MCKKITDLTFCLNMQQPYWSWAQKACDKNHDELEKCQEAEAKSVTPQGFFGFGPMQASCKPSANRMQNTATLSTTVFPFCFLKKEDFP